MRHPIPITAVLLASSLFLLARIRLFNFLSKVLLVSASFLQGLVRRRLLLGVSYLASLDAEGFLWDGDDLLEGILGNVLQLGPWRVTLLDALLARLLWEDQQLRLVQLEAVNILLEALGAPVASSVVHRDANSGGKLWSNLRRAQLCKR